jgi:hypothetical protein
VVVTPLQSPPGPFTFFFTWPWAIVYIYMYELWAIASFSCPDDSLALWPSGVLERWRWRQDAESRTLAIRTHTGRECKCIAGLRFVLIPQPGPGLSTPSPGID